MKMGPVLKDEAIGPEKTEHSLSTRNLRACSCATAVDVRRLVHGDEVPLLGSGWALRRDVEVQRNIVAGHLIYIARLGLPYEVIKDKRWCRGSHRREGEDRPPHRADGVGCARRIIMTDLT